jgi:hypothetical protein
MLEMVLTHPAYRGQGLVRAQIKHFLQAVQLRGFDLGIIWGIPYYYRQYGYGYCLDGDVYEALPAWQIPGSEPGQTYPYQAPLRVFGNLMRPAGVEDIPGLCQLYNQSVASLQLHVLRDPAYWEYLLRWAGFPVQVLEQESSGELAGYAAFTRSADGHRLRILESAIPRAELGLDLLRRLYKEDSQEILIAWPQNGTLAALARNLGSRALLGGQWLLRIPDMVRFLQKIGPVLEERLAASAWQGLSMDFVLNFYRQAFKLRFNAGKLAGVEPLGFVDTSMGADGGHCCIPPEAFLRLAFGYRSLDELRDAWPDVVIKPQVRSLVDVMFPPMISYLTTPYHTMKAS